MFLQENILLFNTNYPLSQTTSYPAVGSCEIPGTSCKMIRQVIGRTSSGEYFIDPTKSGDPFKVFCDMKTDGGELEVTLE